MSDALRALLLFLPAAVANGLPVLANHIPGLRNWHTPVDFGKYYRGRRILGDHKTWRGLVTGTIGGMMTGALIYAAYPSLVHHFADIPFTPLLEMIIIGGVLGFGALAGDVAESFFKRRRNVLSGQSWFPFDQIDYIFGGLLFVWPLVNLSAAQAVLIVMVYFCVHLIASYIGYLLKLKDKPV